jgi:5-methylcytosine-specific restriction endonuclease McrA
MRDFTPRPKNGIPEKKPKAELKRTPIKKKVSPKQRARIKLNQEYYANAIAANKKKNYGLCVCENCSKTIPNPKGSNVSHIVSAGANTALYLDIENHFILCGVCEAVWSCFDKTTMNIYKESEERRIRLNHKYYNE